MRRHRELLEMTDQDRIVELRAGIVQDEHRGRRQLLDERQGMFGVGRVHLGAMPVAGEPARDRPGPHGQAAEFRGTTGERHETRLILHLRDDQRVTGDEQEAQIVTLSTVPHHRR